MAEVYRQPLGPIVGRQQVDICDLQTAVKTLAGQNEFLIGLLLGRSGMAKDRDRLYREIGLIRDLVSPAAMETWYADTA